MVDITCTHQMLM